MIVGETFTQEELDELLHAAVDPEKGVVNYKEFVVNMAASVPAFGGLPGVQGT